MRSSPFLVQLIAGMLFVLTAVPGLAVESVLAYRDRIEQGYNARDSQAIESTIAELEKSDFSSDQKDLATYYVAFARLRQSAIPGIDKRHARDYLEQCIKGLEPMLERRSDYAQAHALHASCLGASSSYYVLAAATRGIAAGREMTAALKLAPDNPWVVFQDAVSDFSTPAIFGGSKSRALEKLRRAEQLFVASRPTGSTEPVFGEAETWLYVGRVYLANGDKAKAKEAFDKALTLAPRNADVRDELARL